MAACAAPDLEQPSHDLVASPPERWVETLPPVLRLGPSIAPHLVRELSASPDAPGRQAALLALGELKNREAVPFLIVQATSDRAFAYEAALALGKLGDERAAAPLRELAAGRDRDVTARTAAACALLALGHAGDAVPLMRAVLLAATPAGQELMIEHGLPDKTRWALERTLIIEAIARYAEGETFGLDPDSSWPRLAEGVRQFTAYAEAAGK